MDGQCSPDDPKNELKISFCLFEGFAKIIFLLPAAAQDF